MDGARVDYAQVVLDLRAAITEQSSWSRTQLRELIDAAEQRHRAPTIPFPTAAPLAGVDDQSGPAMSGQ